MLKIGNFHKYTEENYKAIKGRGNFIKVTELGMSHKQKVKSKKEKPLPVNKDK